MVKYNFINFFFLNFYRIELQLLLSSIEMCIGIGGERVTLNSNNKVSHEKLVAFMFSSDEDHIVSVTDRHIKTFSQTKYA